MFATLFLLALTATVSTAQTSGPSDADILTLAYNLEILEGQFYSCAAFGVPLSPSILGGGPQVSGCHKANLSSAIAPFAAELAKEETAHAQLLFNALQAAGATPVAPAVDIDGAISAAAQTAFNSATPLIPRFDAYANDQFFLHAAFLFEDLGASAYLGAIPAIQSTSYKATAGSIGNAESYHSSLIRTLLYTQLNTVPAYGKTVGQITSTITDALNSLAGPPTVKYNLGDSTTARVANVNAQGLIPTATVAQVLKTVTGGAPAGKGGLFFPYNLTGKLKN